MPSAGALRKSQLAFGTFHQGRGNLTWTKSNPVKPANNVWVRPTLVRAHSGPAGSPRRHFMQSASCITGVVQPVGDVSGKRASLPPTSAATSVSTTGNRSWRRADGSYPLSIFLLLGLLNRLHRFPEAPRASSGAPSGSSHLPLPVHAPAKLPAAPVVQTPPPLVFSLLPRSGSCGAASARCCWRDRQHCNVGARVEIESPLQPVHSANLVWSRASSSAAAAADSSTRATPSQSVTKVRSRLTEHTLRRGRRPVRAATQLCGPRLSLCLVGSNRCSSGAAVYAAE